MMISGEQMLVVALQRIGIYNLSSVFTVLTLVVGLANGSVLILRS